MTAWTFQLGQIHLVNQNESPTPAGSPRLWYTTPFYVREHWTPKVAKPDVLYGGGQPLANGQRPLFASYPNVQETIPMGAVGIDADSVATAISELKTELSNATAGTPVIWRHRPFGASFDLYAEVYSATVQETTSNEVGPVEGWPSVDAEISLDRSPFFGADELTTLLSAVSFTNGSGGDVQSLGTLLGDLTLEGQPLNITIAKPTSQAAASVVLATIYSRTAASVAQAKTTTSTTTGTAYTTTGNMDMAALRTRAGLSLHLVGRFTTLTNPSKCQAQIVVKTAGGGTLWQSPWRALSTDATAQYMDFGGAPLDMLRVPLAASAASNITLTVSLRSSDGTSVTATLDYLEALLAYDFCTVDCAGGLAASQHYTFFGAQNLNGGGYQPMVPEGALALDSSEVAVKAARIRGQLPRAFTGASLYVAWYDSGRAHTKTDTAAVTVQHAPLWRSLRGVS